MVDQLDVRLGIGTGRGVDVLLVGVVGLGDESVDHRLKLSRDGGRGNTSNDLPFVRSFEGFLHIQP
jgi:hypothetical protein